MRKIGHNPVTLEINTLITAIIGKNMKVDQIPSEMTQRMEIGNTEPIAYPIQAKVLDAGIESLKYQYAQLHAG
ncbi:hypothetical protein [Mycobacterium leprae]|uniref:hypothetical protein n=1 Tax=Mycobacterium leprae TaxID=1769 RepID=UPI000A3EA385|nr:hypothetical protein [Mycobacterium leprae]